MNRITFKPSKARIQKDKRDGRYFLVLDLDECASISKKITKEEARLWADLIHNHFKKLIVD